MVTDQISDPEPRRYSFWLALLLFTLLAMSIVLFSIIQGAALVQRFTTLATLDATCAGNHCSFAIKLENGEAHAVTLITGPNGSESSTRASLGPHQQKARAEITLDCPGHIVKFTYGQKTAKVRLNLR